MSIERVKDAIRQEVLPGVSRLAQVGAAREWLERLLAADWGDVRRINRLAKELHTAAKGGYWPRKSDLDVALHECVEAARSLSMAHVARAHGRVLAFDAMIRCRREGRDGHEAWAIGSRAETACLERLRV